MRKTILFTLVICALVLTGCTEQLNQAKEKLNKESEPIVIDPDLSTEPGESLALSGAGIKIVQGQEDWTTYRDEKTLGFGIRGFEFEYPAPWEVFTETVEAGSSVTLRYKVSELAGDRYPAFHVKSMPNQGGLTLEQWWQEVKESPSYIVRERVGIRKVAGIEAYEFRSGEMGAGPSYVFIYEGSGKSGWIFDITTGSEAEKETIDRIVESFKLIED